MYQSCHQISEIRGFDFQSGENQGKKKDILKNQGSFRVTIVSFLSGDFLYTQSHIQSSMKIARFSPIFIAFCSVQLF